MDFVYKIKTVRDQHCFYLLDNFNFYKGMSSSIVYELAVFLGKDVKSPRGNMWA